MTDRDLFPPSAEAERDDATMSTREVAQLFGMAVRSVQLMVDRGELEAWRTPGGHRRISRASVDAWLAARRPGGASGPKDPGGAARRPLPAAPGKSGARRLLYIEDSRHFQNLVSLLLAQRYPGLEVHLADEGLGGLALAGQLRPDLLLVDILLPGIDGATLITSLRSHPAFAGISLIVLTSLEPDDLAPYAFALEGVPVVHKPRLVQELPPLIDAALAKVR